MKAFPCDSRESSVFAGMDLRDYFAAKALQGMLAEPSLKATAEEFANKSYELADAMMKARKV
jgi:hypothetical protein